MPRKAMVALVQQLYSLDSFNEAEAVMPRKAAIAGGGIASIP